MVLYLRNSSSYRLCTELEKCFERLAVQTENKNLRKLDSILTTGNYDELRFKLPLKEKDFKIICAYSWYIKDDTLRLLLQDTLAERVQKYHAQLQDQVALLLLDKCHSIIYILESDVLGKTPQEVFGNILAHTFEIKVFDFKERKPIRIEFHRGYRDKGSRVLDNHGRHEFPKDYLSTMQQNEIEADREQRSTRTNFIEGWLD